MLWSIFITYIITHHGLGGFSGLINGLIAAAIGALSMLMSEPTAKKLCKEDMYFCPLNRDIYIYIYKSICDTNLSFIFERTTGTKGIKGRN